MQSSTGRARAITSAGPPTIRVNAPATANSAVFPTGLSLIAAPLPAVVAPILRVASDVGGVPADRRAYPAGRRGIDRTHIDENGVATDSLDDAVGPQGDAL